MVARKKDKLYSLFINTWTVNAVFAMVCKENMYVMYTSSQRIVGGLVPFWLASLDVSPLPFVSRLSILVSVKKKKSRLYNDKKRDK